MIERYKKYVKALLEDEYHFDEEEVKDILQSIELAVIEANVRDADKDMTFAIIRKATISAIKQREKEREELKMPVLEYEHLTNVYEENEMDEGRKTILRVFSTLSNKERGILLSKFLKNQEVDEEFAEVVIGLTDEISKTNPELADSIYQHLNNELVRQK